MRRHGGRGAPGKLGSLAGTPNHLDVRSGRSAGSSKYLQKEGTFNEPTDERGLAQLQLPLELISVLPHPLEHVRSEAIEVLADLLLEAMGPEENGSVEIEEVSDERRNHA
jgi:hypothetical protein